jgi:flavin-dependent dehydrogenase
VIGNRYDIVILGGGPAGLATAIAVRRRIRATVLVAEAGPADRERVGESAAPALLVPLGQLGLTGRFQADGHVPCPGTASLWGRDRVGYNDSLYDPMGPSWRLDRRRFDAMLADAAREAGAEVVFDTPFHGADPVSGQDASPGTDKRGYRLTLGRSRRTVTADLVVDATGFQARFARGRGARRLVDDAFFALVRFARLRSGTMPWQTLLEAAADGWWYAARLPGERVVVMLAADRAGIRRVSDDRGWASGLADTRLIGGHLGNAVLDPAGPPLLLPVHSGRLDRPGGLDWLAVGDAAAGFDPIAAQGLYKALTDGVAAGPVMAAMLSGAAETGEGARAHAIATRHADYAATRTHLYRLERRWPGSSFWRRRAGIQLADTPSNPQPGQEIPA